jgi:hypothetical protein
MARQRVFLASSRLMLTALLAACACAGTVAAQTPPPFTAQTAPPPPPNAAPPPLPDTITDPDLEPKVTIIRRDGQTIEEVRIAGQLRYVKVTPPHGVPYYLVPSADGQRFSRRDLFGPALSVPMWELFSW